VHNFGGSVPLRKTLWVLGTLGHVALLTESVLSFYGQFVLWRFNCGYRGSGRRSLPFIILFQRSRKDGNICSSDVFSVVVVVVVVSSSSS
jgi:hypothetical protein